MSYTKRVQVLMEPDEFAALERLALQNQASVADLIRQAVQERWLGGTGDRKAAAQQLCAMGLRSLSETISDAEVTATRSQGISGLEGSTPKSGGMP